MKDIELLNEIYTQARTTNREIWKLITELHDTDGSAPEIKERLIEISGNICMDILAPLEKKYDFLGDKDDA